MKLTKQADLPGILHNPDGESIQEVLGMVAGQVTSHSLAQITIAPGKASSPHFHEHSEESYFILSGEASLEIDHQKISLLPGEAILIEPYEVHKISNQSNQDLVFIAVCVPAWSPDDSFDADKSD